MLFKQILAFRPSRMDLIFAVKTFIAMMLALYTAFVLDLTYPMWAAGTVIIIAQPYAGMVSSKALYRLTGTILGGIWADQSWGRFWGWDPKENGALLIVMWQIMMLHLRITGLVKPMGFALGMILNNIVVILAWFGVNLLNVGLHSYGFASGIAINISLFISFEFITGLGTYYWAKNRHKSVIV